MLFSKSINPYRLVGDSSHVIATWILLFKLIHTRSASGVSGKSQLLLAMTYTFRYLDLFTNYVSDYNTVLKCYYIIVSWLICYMVWTDFSGTTYQKEKDSFRFEFLILIVTILASLVNHEFTFLEISWTWSIYMESVALLPQLYMIWTTKKTNGYIILYVLAMALYRGFYIANWMYRYTYEDYYDIIAIISGCVETFVGLFGLITIITISLVKPSNSHSSSSPGSIYTLPSVVNEFGKDYKILRNTEEEKPKNTGAIKSEEPVKVKPENFEDIL